MDTFLNMANSMENHLKRYGLPNEVGFSFLALLPSEPAEEISKHVTELLVKDGMDRMSKHEFYLWIANHMLRSRIKLPTVKAYDLFLSSLEAKYDIHLMKPDRYTAILHRLRGFEQRGRSGDDTSQDTWMQRKNLLRRLEGLEKMMFKPSLEILLNRKSGELVLDDELLGYRAKDVETKTLSDRKAGKEGPVFDAIACLHTGMLFGTRLRVSGTSEIDNIASLLTTLPDLQRWIEAMANLRCWKL
jgi:hypothetical protein